MGEQQPRFTGVAEAHSRVLDVQACPIREVNAEGHRGGRADDGGPILLLQALVEDLHVQQAQEPEGSTDFRAAVLAVYRGACAADLHLQAARRPCIM